MGQVLHGCATTTEAVRRAIQADVRFCAHNGLKSVIRACLKSAVTASCTAAKGTRQPVSWRIGFTFGSSAGVRF